MIAHNFDRCRRISFHICDNCFVGGSVATIRVQTRRHEKNSRSGGLRLLKHFIGLMGLNQKNILFNETEFIHALIYLTNSTLSKLIIDPLLRLTWYRRGITHFFPMEKQILAIVSGNCLPGTVAKEDITHPFEFDFYS
ncbi:uncharacterized protein OCT59_001343 [Rhizophagus irregularis]|uniref:uncharacterized protein n=1 Tax=Rhizophagus irregularis TaxID=588596 RepID=UPI00332DF318|nr:hypothetical protein OCT59_001343 [Rhizophagus irregularis]